MVLLILIILIAAAITGSLWAVLKIAAGVAIGLFLFVTVLALTGYYLVRHQWRRANREYRDRRGLPPDRYV
jgi:membrane protein implicated in regulation of membrane protease activity